MLDARCTVERGKPFAKFSRSLLSLSLSLSFIWGQDCTTIDTTNILSLKAVSLAIVGTLVSIWFLVYSVYWYPIMYAKQTEGWTVPYSYLHSSSLSSLCFSFSPFPPNTCPLYSLLLTIQSSICTRWWLLWWQCSSWWNRTVWLPSLLLPIGRWWSRRSIRWLRLLGRARTPSTSTRGSPSGDQDRGICGQKWRRFRKNRHRASRWWSKIRISESLGQRSRLLPNAETATQTAACLRGL